MSIGLRIKKLESIVVSTVLVILAVQLLFINSVHAQVLQNVIKKADLKLDTSIIVDDDNYSQPQSILVTPVFMTADTRVSAEEWYRGLYYYLSSDRYNFKDLPAHYVLDRDGNLYEGVKGGVERSLLVENAPERPVLIFYLAEKGDSDLSLAARAKLEGLMLSLANDNRINPKSIQISGLKLRIDSERKQVQLFSEEIFGSWNITFKKLVENVAAKYKPANKNYSLDLLEFANPAQAVNANQEVVLKLKVKNTGQYSIFADSDSELILTTADGKDSPLFLNESWVSKSQLPLLPSGTILRPNAEATYEFRVKAPFIFGEAKQEFVIKNAGGQSFDNAKLTVKLTVARNGLKVLEILNTETGTLNVRESAFGSAAVIGKASPGERYVWSEKSSSGLASALDSDLASASSALFSLSAI